ncbi:hypothetical protein AVEN_75022-1 [Araneus ventricosus]|uniref:Uncharacterized protein n=1 Tax=Araneus ventricosus TaxID=182803 RepID=A0A4Y2GPC5_ARAVE|nr:hypothetical protein AVEN_75022-1 [Araneus ventricosus]
MDSEYYIHVLGTEYLEAECSLNISLVRDLALNPSEELSVQKPVHGSYGTIPEFSLTLPVLYPPYLFILQPVTTFKGSSTTGKTINIPFLAVGLLKIYRNTNRSYVLHTNLNLSYSVSKLFCAMTHLSLFKILMPPI